jgi:hypothetical protein
MTTAQDRPLVLGLHPTARGVSWAAFADPFTVHHHGVYRASRSNKCASSLKKVAWLLGRLKPEILVLEAFDAESSVRSKRIRKLCLEIVNLAAEQGVEVAVYRRCDVQDAFRIVEARTREEIAEAVARHVGSLRPYLPNKRKQWAGEDRRLSLFCASALVLTHYHFEATRLFDDMRKAA